MSGSWNPALRLGLLLIAFTTALLATGCGGDGEEEREATGPSSAQNAIGIKSEAKKGATARRREQTGADNMGGEGSQAPGGADEQTEPSRGGEASIEDFGAEAAGSERAAILASFDGYLTAVADRDHESACDHLSSTVKRSLSRLAAKGLKVGSCPAVLAKLLAPTAAAIARQQAGGEITRVRVQGDRAFVVFKAPGAELYQLTMVREAGEWKAAIVAGSVLVPTL